MPAQFVKLHNALLMFIKGTQKALRGDTKAMATVTAIIDGTGSLGTGIILCSARVSAQLHL